MREIRKNLISEQKYLKALDNTIQKSLVKAPEGSLRSSVSNHCLQYYHMYPNAPNRKVGKYIRKSNLQLTKALAQKAYDKKLLPLVRVRLDLLNQLIDSYDSAALENTYASLPKHLKELVDPRGLSDDAFVKAWLETPFISKGFRPDDPEIYTDQNERVRSKSEKIIADKLYRMNIPYRYECQLKLDDGTIVYPDFTILNVRTRQVFYLEHLGMMDNGEYSGKAVEKLILYEKNGISIGKKLVLTFETSDHPLDAKFLNQIIQENFL